MPQSPQHTKDMSQGITQHLIANNTMANITHGTTQHDGMIQHNGMTQHNDITETENGCNKKRMWRLIYFIQADIMLYKKKPLSSS